MSEKPCFINEDELRSRLNGDGKTKLTVGMFDKLQSRMV